MNHGWNNDDISLNKEDLELLPKNVRHMFCHQKLHINYKREKNKYISKISKKNSFRALLDTRHNNVIWHNKVTMVLLWRWWVPQTPWHLTNGYGNSTRSTGGHVWSIPGNCLEKLGAGCLEIHQWPSLVHWWIRWLKTAGHWWKSTIVGVEILHAAHSDAEKMGKNTQILARNFAITYSREAIPQSKEPKFTNF